LTQIAAPVVLENSAYSDAGQSCGEQHVSQLFAI